MDKPEALRLADVTRLSRHHEWHLQVDAELRRLHAENERLAAEVANRNRRALDGDEAVSALANVHAYYEGLEAQRDALLEALKEITPSMPPVDAPCHYGIVPQEKCGHCGRIAKARAAIKAVEETK